MNGGRQDIKMMMATIRPDKLSGVKTTLAEVGTPSLTVTNVSDRDSQPAKKRQWRDGEYTVDLHQEVRVEYVVADIPTDDVVDAIVDTTQTGEKGDGKIFVSPIESAVQVRVGREDETAV